MKFRSPTNEPMHIALTTGHTVVIPPEGVDLEPRFRREAISRGAEPVGAGEATVEADSPQFNRADVIEQAMIAMIDAGSEDDFTKDGRPDMRKLNARVGFAVERGEVDAIWAKLNTEVK